MEQKREQDKVIGTVSVCTSAVLSVHTALCDWQYICIYYIHVFVEVPGGNTCSALLLLGPGDTEL